MKKKEEKKGPVDLHYLFAALLSTLVFSVGVAVIGYTFLGAQLIMTFHELFIRLLMYAGTLYVFPGILLFWLIETFKRWIGSQDPLFVYGLSTSLYSVAGFFIIGVLSIFVQGDPLQRGVDFILYGVFGAVAALIYYHVFLIVQIWFKRITTTTKNS
ncbi:hypothetical protein [Salsuginibacillus kocurii]|uniref:hypothetical protein n=1 Tax=Salsuginibacillus kocurii TaxID=427078 RepID=UPI000360F03E|nr:hypothetical protein [Salsuginibacillus kocurii]